MDCTEWIERLGKSADDAAVRAGLKAAKITKPMKLAADELTVRADIKGEGVTLIFTDESVLYPGKGLVGRPILSSILMVLSRATNLNVYGGPLPFEFKRTDSQESLRRRFGVPVTSNEEYRADAWLVDGCKFSATYSLDLQSLSRLAVALPEH